MNSFVPRIGQIENVRVRGFMPSSYSSQNGA